VGQPFDHLGLPEKIAQHEHGNQGRCRRNQKKNDKGRHNRESNLFQFIDLSCLFHPDFSLGLCGHQAHDGRLNNGDQCHVGIGSNCAHTQHMGGKLGCQKDGGGPVCPSDDSDGGSLLDVKSHGLGRKKGDVHPGLGPGPEEQQRGVEGEKPFELWRSFDKDLARDMSLYITGTMYSREKIPHTTRQFVTVAALTVLDRPDELKLHIEAALNVGSSGVIKPARGRLATRIPKPMGSSSSGS